MDARKAVETVLEAGWNRQDFEGIDEAMAESVELHVGRSTRTTSIEEMAAIVARWHERVAGFRFDIHSIVASEGMAAARVVMRGRNPDDDRTVSVEHMFFFRFDNHRIVEVWELLDRPALESQLG
ncbi:MAG TPA: ester cyclase [Acidimicrobiia bacterium]|nr:ester cyclase [Acidimicrobiia bacterium]